MQNFLEDRFTSASNKQKSSHPKFNQNYRGVMTLVEGIPLSVGMKLRRLVYPHIFARMGTNVQIEPNVNFTRSYLIELGNGVYIRSGANIEVCGENSQLNIRDKVLVERGVDIRVHDGGYIDIGNLTTIGAYTCLSGRNIKIGNNCLIASHIGIYASNHLFVDASCPILKQGYSYQGITIEDDCWLGNGVRVLDGVKIGRGSVIGAGAVVTKYIPPYSVAVGVPAKVISQRELNCPI